MNSKRLFARGVALAGWMLLVIARSLHAQPQPVLAPGDVLIVALEGAEQAQFLRRTSTDWDRAYTNQVLHPGDEFRTGRRSRALLRFSDEAVVPIGPRT